MTSRMVNDTGTFIPSNVLMESTTPVALTWGLNKVNITVTTLCSSHREPGTDSAPPTALSGINLNLFQHFLSTLKLPGLPPSTAIYRGEIDLHLKLWGMKPWDEVSLPPYLCRLTGKNVSESIRDQIITGQVLNTEYYDGHRVSIPSTLLKTIKKTKYISEDPNINYRTAHK